MDVRSTRLARQAIAGSPFDRPADVVAWFGAMQAQDYLAARWALGLRTRGATESSIEAALSDGSVIRTHAFRGTWQYIAPRDVRWILGLVGARVIASAASRHRELGLDERTRRRACERFATALEGGRCLTRDGMRDVLARAKIDPSASRLLHLLGVAELEGLICSGPRAGNQPTFALLEERIPKAPALARDEAVVELARRYFQSRGPATIRDFVWWTGLTAADARVAIGALGLAAAGGHYSVPGPAPRAAPGAHLLPAFDEYLVAYQDRSAVIDADDVRKVNRGGGMLKPTIAIGGRVAGLWSRTLQKDRVVIDLAPFSTLSARERAAVDGAAARYATFLGRRL